MLLLAWLWCAPGFAAEGEAVAAADGPAAAEASVAPPPPADGTPTNAAPAPDGPAADPAGAAPVTRAARPRRGVAPQPDPGLLLAVGVGLAWAFALYGVRRALPGASA